MDRTCFLRENNIKVTKSRIAILDVLIDEHNPVSAEEIYNKVKNDKLNLNLSTVYRTLELFAEKDIVKKYNLDNSTSTYIFSKEHHKHVVLCKVCHKEVEIDCPMEQLKMLIKSKTGITINEEELEFKIQGICEDCENE